MSSCSTGVQHTDNCTGGVLRMPDPLCPEDFGAIKFNLRQHRWKYRGEGNANIAISLPDQRKLIRLPKFRSCENPGEVELWKRLSTNNLFISVVMKQILGPMFVSPPSLIYLSNTDIDYLNNELDSVRPENRKHKKLSYSGGEICNDHAFIPPKISESCGNQSVCIELKLKQGVFPPTGSQLSYCAFCCKQELKLKDGSASKRSKYCPLDVFSGSLARIKHAVKSLLQTPQNNLRIFCDGNLAYGDGYSVEDLQLILSLWLHSIPGSDLVERFTCLLVQALTMQVGHECEGSTNSSWLYNGTPFFDTSKSVHHGTLKEEFPRINQKPCNFEKQNLPEGCILHRLAQAQALDQYGVNLVFNMLMTDQDLVRATENVSASYDTQYVHSIIKRGCSYELNPIELYLISATVRDCSVLICLQELKGNNFEAEILPVVEDEPSRTKYILKITAVDLDPKPLSCVKSHMQRNELVQDACRGTSS